MFQCLLVRVAEVGEEDGADSASDCLELEFFGVHERFVHVFVYVYGGC